MSFHLLANHTTTVSGPSTLAQMGLVNDAVISQQNSGFIFTGNFLLGVIFGMGASMTQLRMNMPTLNCFGRDNIWPIESTGVQPAVVPDLAQICDLLPRGIAIPQNEPLFFEYSQTVATAEDEIALAWVFTSDHQWTTPKGIQRIYAKATPAAITSVAYTWSGPSALTFEQNLRGGWWAVMGVDFVDANTLAMRLIFPRAPLYNDRVLRPGSLAQNAVARRPNPRFLGRLGVWGAFHTYEPPQVEILAVNAAAHTPDMRMDLIYLGDVPASMYPTQQLAAAA